MDEISRAIRHFQKGIASAVIGFAYAAVIEALLKAFLGPYVPAILISATMFVAGVISDAETITNQDHWFVFGVVFISVFIDLLSLVLGMVFLVAGYLLRTYLESR